MASPRQLPDRPQPYSVLTEHWQDKLRFPETEADNTDDICSFGDVYEDNLYKLIHKHLELDTHDRFAYVGASKGSVASKIKDHFCLLKPMVNIFPGLIHYEQTSNQRMLPFKIAHVGAEEYFRQLSDDIGDNKAVEPPFDKILLKDCVEHFTNPALTFAHIMKTLSKHGRILILHRPGPMATLPFFSEATRRFSDEGVADEPYIKIIKNLQANKVDVKWEIETIPIVMPKTKWLAMLQEKFPPQMEIISKAHVQSGIRELTEGMLKYQGDMVEFYDRLLFITATHSLVGGSYPSIQRCGASDALPYPGVATDMKYTLKVTPDLYAHVQTMEREMKDANQILH